MVFSYYNRLTASQKRVYRKSDEITSLPLPGAEALRPFVVELERALTEDDRRRVESVCLTLAAGIIARLQAPPVRVRVLATRPSATWGELHGLYEGTDGPGRALISLWMRTAKHRKVVAFRSFLRTLLHELCHHLDYEVFRFPDSFHTRGFYQRESSLFHQLVPEGAKNRGPASRREGSGS